MLTDRGPVRGLTDGDGRLALTVPDGWTVEAALREIQALKPAPVVVAAARSGLRGAGSRQPLREPGVPHPRPRAVKTDAPTDVILDRAP